MQTNGSLSPEQYAVLQSTLVFLNAVTSTLDTQARVTTLEDVELTRTVKDLGLYCIDRMLTAFPTLAEWRALGDGGVQ